MNKTNTNIDKLVSKILNEEIESKVKELTEEWTEVETKESLKGGQKKLDVAEPKGKLDAADFKKLRDKKKETKESEEMDEWFFYDDEKDESTPGDYEGDEDAEDEAEELSQQEPTYVGKGIRKPKMMGSFDDEHGWFDEHDRPTHSDDMDDYDEEEFHDFPSLYAKHGSNQVWFDKNQGEKFFKRYQDKFGGKPFRVRTARDMDEAETEEGNEFTGALANAKKNHEKSFEVDGKKYPVKEGKEKWIQKTGMKKGALHKKLGVAEGDKIPQAKLKSLKKELMKKAEGDKKLSAADSKLLKQVNLALTLKGIKESKNSLKLTENELIDLIEKLVVEQQVKDKAEKDNIAKKSPEGLKKTIKAQNVSKKENDDYAKEVVKKMKDYLKKGHEGDYETNPENFPQSNGQLKRQNAMKYTPSDAVEEYIDAFAHPGMTNLVFDEIKPDDKKIEKYLKGDKTTGNAEFDESKKALGNVVPSKVGDKFMKNYKENLYGQEQMDVSYKRYPQPVDQTGETLPKGELKKLRGKKTAQNVVDAVSENADKGKKLINEDMNKMKNLIFYSRKTQ